MSLSSIEKLLSNVDISILIYNLLEFGDQLRLSQVNNQLKSVFEYYIWKESYGTLKIFVEKCNVVITCGMEVNRIVLHPNYIGDFIVVCADRVRDLTLLERNISETFMRCDIMDKYALKFRNLRSLNLYNMKISVDGLESTVMNCGDELQELNFIYCRINIKEFVDAKLMENLNLKRLHIVDNTSDNIETFQLQKIVNMPKLEILKLNTTLVQYRESDDFRPPLTSNLKELDICADSFHSLKWLPFEKLTIMKLNIKQYLTDEILSSIAESCKHLEKLTLVSIFFENITSLSLPPNLADLSLICCKGLTYVILKQILTQFQIEKFCSRDTLYHGEFRSFRPSPLIKSIGIECGDISNFKCVIENNTELQELVCYNKFENDANDVNYIPLGDSNSNLLRLDVPWIQMSTVSQLSSLQCLTISGHTLGWNYVVDLLKLPTLKELTFRHVVILLGYSPLVAVSTNITRLTITLDMLESSIPFWLDLFCRNKRLTIKCFFEDFHVDVLCIEDMINHENFPKNLKTVDISGLRIDCDELRQDHNSIWEKVSNWTYFPLPADWILDKEITNDFTSLTHRMILSWN